MSDRPRIILPSGSVTNADAADAIFKLIGEACGMFYRGGRVVDLTDGKLSPVDPAGFCSRLDHFGDVMAWRKGREGKLVLQRTDCSIETARVLLASQEAILHLPRISFISACPIAANVDGQFQVLEPGYHAHNGGTFITGSVMPQEVPLEAAIDTLIEIFGDFLFQTPGDLLTTLSMALAPGFKMGGWLRKKLPVHVIEADASQSGKTYLRHLIAAIYGTLLNLIGKKTGGVGSGDESLAQKLVEGNPFITFENWRGPLDSPYLEMITSQDTDEVPVRVPNRPEATVDVRNCAFALTSNAATITRDLGNRSVFTRIAKQPPGHQFFNDPVHGDRLAWVRAHQPYCLGCVHAVIKAYVEGGCGKTDENRHDFREFARTLDWVVQHIFGETEHRLMDNHEVMRERICDPRRVWLRELLLKLGNTSRKFTNAGALVEFCDEKGLEIPGLNSPSQAPQQMGKVMEGLFKGSGTLREGDWEINRAQGGLSISRHLPMSYHFIYLHTIETSADNDQV